MALARHWGLSCKRAMDGTQLVTEIVLAIAASICLQIHAEKSHSHALTHILTHMQVYKHTHTNPHTPAYAHQHMHTHTHKHIHTHTGPGCWWSHVAYCSWLWTLRKVGALRLHMHFLVGLVGPFPNAHKHFLADEFLEACVQIIC
jgi:hypothetical protein